MRGCGPEPADPRRHGSGPISIWPQNPRKERPIQVGCAAGPPARAAPVRNSLPASGGRLALTPQPRYHLGSKPLIMRGRENQALRIVHLAVALVTAAVALLAPPAPAGAVEAVRMNLDVQAIDLTPAIERYRSDGGDEIRISTAPGRDGIVRRIAVKAREAGTRPDWIVFALTNDTDEQIDRLLAAPRASPRSRRARASAPSARRARRPTSSSSPSTRAPRSPSSRSSAARTCPRSTCGTPTATARRSPA
jgi:hypothetical protein